MIEPSDEPPADKEQSPRNASQRSFLSVQREKRLAEQSEHSQYQELSVDNDSSMERYERKKAERKNKKKPNPEKAASLMATYHANKYKRDLRDLKSNQVRWIQERNQREQEQKERPESFVSGSEIV